MSLLLWYPFTQDGREQGAIYLAPTTVPTFEANGMLGKNAFLNSKEINTGVELLTEWNPWEKNVSMSAWIKLNLNECKQYVKTLTYNSSAHTPTGCIMGSTSYGGLGICWSGTKVYTDSGNVDITGINVFGYLRGSAQKTTSSSPITFDKWTHVALVANKETSTLSFYVDGVLKGSVSYSGTTATTGSRPFVMCHGQVYGGNGPGGKLPMRLNDVRLYDEALSLTEIKELSKGLMIHYAFNDVASEATTNLITNISTVTRCVKYLDGVKVDWATNSGDTYFFMDTNSPIVSGKTYTLSFVCSGIGSANITFAISNVSATHTVKLKDGFNSYTFVANDTIANRFFFDDINRNTFSVFTITNLQLEEKDHSTPYTIGTRTYDVMFDDSGNGHDAIPYNMTLSTDTNNGTLAAKFNGSTSYYEVPVPRSDMFKTPYTLSFWVNPDDDGRAVYFGDHSTTGGVSMNFERKSGGAFRYYHGGSPDKEVSGLTSPVGVWTMITVTSNGTTMKFYKNGTEVSNSAYTFTPTITKSSGHMRIGRDNRSDSTALAGRISDFRWYATALSADDVKTLYESKAAIDKNNNIFANEIIEQQNTNLVNADSWEQGGITDASGTNADNMMNRLRTKYIPVLPNTKYYFKAATGYNVRGVHRYRSDMTWINYNGTTVNSMEDTTPSDCYYVRWVLQSTNASNEVSVANIATYQPVMVIKDFADSYGFDTNTDVEVTNKYILKTKDIIEGHEAGFFKDGTASGNNFNEI